MSLQSDQLEDKESEGNMLQKVIYKFGDWQDLKGRKTCVNWKRKNYEYDRNELSAGPLGFAQSPSPVRLDDSPMIRDADGTFHKAP